MCQIIYKFCICRIYVRKDYIDCGIERCEAKDVESTIYSCQFHPLEKLPVYTRPKEVTYKRNGNKYSFNARLLS
ncbi:hypothetical protein JTB14_005520 [Gonioctena quinquepunctata]|nr:hypothetical protein JTB14_005520 [Gonioctena quinquepunctata]